jgi:hypothetical protein
MTPRHISKANFAKLGLDLARREPLTVRCQQCGVEWHPQVISGLKINVIK